MFGWGQLACHHQQALVCPGMVFKIPVHIYPEQSKISNVTSVDGDTPVGPYLFVVGLDFFLSLIYIGTDSLYFLKPWQFLIRNETDHSLLDEQGTLYTPSSGILHPTPVFKRVRNQGIGGNGGDCL